MLHTNSHPKSAFTDAVNQVSARWTLAREFCEFMNNWAQVKVVGEGEQNASKPEKRDVGKFVSYAGRKRNF